MFLEELEPREVKVALACSLVKGVADTNEGREFLNEGKFSFLLIHVVFEYIPPSGSSFYI